MPLNPDAIRMLEETSRTFFVPIIRLPEGLQEAVGSAYLCMRAIDEIEDHAELPLDDKVMLLRRITATFREVDGHLKVTEFQKLFERGGYSLPTVTLRLGDHALHAPEDVAHSVWSATAVMAERMAHWVECDWRIATRDDLDTYTYDVAGAVGLLLTELWNHYEGVRTTPAKAVGFGRALQAVNILRNRDEDLSRGVDFFPDGWRRQEMAGYIEGQLSLAEAYLQELPEGPVHEFCSIPYTLARATVEVMLGGQEKLTRRQVVALMESITGER